MTELEIRGSLYLCQAAVLHLPVNRAEHRELNTEFCVALPGCTQLQKTELCFSYETKKCFKKIWSSLCISQWAAVRRGTLQG